MKHILCIASVLGLSPIIIRGKDFVNSASGAPFLIRGITYMPYGNSSVLEDSLANPDICRRDAPVLRKLGVNTIYVKHTATQEEDHGKCMKIFEDAGIYVLVNLPETDFSITNHYTYDIFNIYLEKAIEFSNYTNTLGLIVASDVSPEYQPYVKAALRDLRKNMKTRRIPLGYSHTNTYFKKISQVMMGCGEKADFYAVDISEDCHYATPDKAATVVKDMLRFPGPTFISGFGCTTVSGTPRRFLEASAIFSNHSGGIVNHYSPKTQLSLVDVQGDAVVVNQEFHNYYTAIHKELNLTDLASNHIPLLYECPENSKVIPPTPNNLTCPCAMQTLRCAASTKASLGYKFNQTMAIYSQLCTQGFCKDTLPVLERNIYPKYYHCKFLTQLSLAMDAAHASGRKCDFDGFASPVDVPSSSPECMALKSFPQTTTKSSSARTAKEKWIIPFLLLLTTHSQY
ncbi:1 3-beta-glucanosyltransferase gel4 [Entomophthora muscae]|uniref:1 3-beta-glucanosyltransferase gel4 n=1 Tax=Entomophthora muscae TaxID=34485 RepID=A0ACC2T0Q2_9FUNG|nr:1 3-beta-glucanosyltransferase gel4 [Entomophthora muscae]